MCGSETLTTVVSSTSMNVGAITATATSHGLTFTGDGLLTMLLQSGSAEIGQRRFPFRYCTDFPQTKQRRDWLPFGLLLRSQNGIRPHGRWEVFILSWSGS